MGKGRAPCCDKSQVKRGPWSPAEDLRLITFIQKHGHENWRALPKQAGLLRCGKSCRLRWINYLRPDVKRGNFTTQEEEAIIKLHENLGNKWSKIASHFPGRTDNEIKNIWNTHLKKRLATKNNSDNSSGDESKETSIASSFSSSSTSIPSCTGKRGLEMELGHQSDEESVPKRPCNNNNHEFTIQEKLNDQDEQKEVATNGFSQNDQVLIARSTTTSSTSSYDSNVSNSTNIDHDQENQMDNFLFDIIGSYDVGDILQEVNKPPDIPEVVPLEADYDFWNMLDSLGTTLLQPNNEQVQVLNNSKPCHISNFGEDRDNTHIENMDWFKYLENELGLVGNDSQIDVVQGVLEEDQSHAMEERVPEESDPSLYFY